MEWTRLTFAPERKRNTNSLSLQPTNTEDDANLFSRMSNRNTTLRPRARLQSSHSCAGPQGNKQATQRASTEGRARRPLHMRLTTQTKTKEHLPSGLTFCERNALTTFRAPANACAQDNAQSPNSQWERRSSPHNMGVSKTQCQNRHGPVPSSEPHRKKKRNHARQHAVTCVGVGGSSGKGAPSAGGRNPAAASRDRQDPCQRASLQRSSGHSVELKASDGRFRIRARNFGEFTDRGRAPISTEFTHQK